MPYHTNFLYGGTLSLAASSGSGYVDIDTSNFNEMQIAATIVYQATSNPTNCSCNVTNGLAPADKTAVFFFGGTEAESPVYDSTGVAQTLNTMPTSKSSPQTVTTVFNVDLTKVGNWVRVTFTNLDSVNACVITIRADAL